MQRRILFVVLWAVALAPAAVVGLLWLDWNDWFLTGCVSHPNYERIADGMSLEEAQALLGSPGEETDSLPGFPPYVHLPGAPPGWTGVVWGDKFLKWKSGTKDRQIYVGFVQGRVVSKWFWEPSP